MKIRFLFLMLIISAFFTPDLNAQTAEQYHVIRVKGTIKVKSTGAVLKTGDKITAETQVVFQDKEAAAAVVSPSKGRFVLKANAAPKSGELVSIVKSALTVSNGQLSARAGRINNKLDLEKHMSEHPYLVLGGITEIPVSKEAFPLTEKTFFYVAYDYKNEGVTKSLPFITGNRFILDRKQVFTVDGEPIDGVGVDKMELVYYNDDTGAATTICVFSPVFADEKALREEVALIKTAFKDKDEKAVQAEVKAYLQEFYGNPGEENFADWWNQIR